MESNKIYTNHNLDFCIKNKIMHHTHMHISHE